jgi:hypothetical protein
MSDLTVQALVPLSDGTVLLHGVSNLSGRAEANLFDPISGATVPLPGGDVIAVGGGPLRPERYVAR